MSSDFSEFLNQGFIRAMLPLMCIISLLLVTTIAAIVYMRRRKAQQALAKVTSPSFVSVDDYASSSNDMPDLDLLMHTPAPSPASAPASVVPPSVAVASAPIRSARKGTFTVVPKDGSSTEAVEVMTILRDVVDGKLIIQMGENAYNNVNNDPEFKERFGKLMREVGQMIGKAGPSAPDTSEAESSISSVESEAEPPPSASDLKQPNEASFVAPKKPPVKPPLTASGKLPGDLPSFKLDDNPMPKLKRGQKNDLPPVPEINIAGAIEAYLQHKISLTPDYAGRSIHIYPASGGGVRIEVDGKYFEAVSDVSDPTVREFLSDTIAEWQDRH